MELHNLKHEIAKIKGGRFKPCTNIRRFTGGTHGSVLFCTDTTSEREVAIKKILNDDDEEGESVHAVRELAAYRRLGHHEYLLQLLDQVRDNNTTYIVFERMKETLKETISNGLDPGMNARFKMQLLRGLEWCHENRIMHRDIKPQNILVQNNVVKLADFGLAKLFSKTSERTHSLAAVTLWYRAIELLLGMTHYNEKLDVWSLGCVFYEMDAAKPLFKTDSEVHTLISIYIQFGNPSEASFPGVSDLKYYNEDLFVRTERCSQMSKVYDSYRFMFIYDPKLRPSARECRCRLEQKGVSCQ